MDVPPDIMDPAPSPLSYSAMYPATSKPIPIMLPAHTTPLSQHNTHASATASTKNKPTKARRTASMSSTPTQSRYAQFKEALTDTTSFTAKLFKSLQQLSLKKEKGILCSNLLSPSIFSSAGGGGGLPFGMRVSLLCSVGGDGNMCKTLDELEVGIEFFLHVLKDCGVCFASGSNQTAINDMLSGSSPGAVRRRSDSSNQHQWTVLGWKATLKEKAVDGDSKVLIELTSPLGGGTTPSDTNQHSSPYETKPSAENGLIPVCPACWMTNLCNTIYLIQHAFIPTSQATCCGLRTLIGGGSLELPCLKNLCALFAIFESGFESFVPYSQYNAAIAPIVNRQQDPPWLKTVEHILNVNSLPDLVAVVNPSKNTKFSMSVTKLPTYLSFNLFPPLLHTKKVQAWISLWVVFVSLLQSTHAHGASQQQPTSPPTWRSVIWKLLQKYANKHTPTQSDLAMDLFTYVIQHQGLYQTLREWCSNDCKAKMRHYLTTPFPTNTSTTSPACSHQLVNAATTSTSGSPSSSSSVVGSVLYNLQGVVTLVTELVAPKQPERARRRRLKTLATSNPTTQIGVEADTSQTRGRKRRGQPMLSIGAAPTEYHLYHVQPRT
eukprot:TRINITY_DN51763_c0_g2_i1.p1 TRINITY_DN51763_c0_g2~~TRINITY_DN51763_c0_g2_i1.p1  ORF type:complete len:665 (+),score=68.59 TRINITY_DN51763_c0_g2_i1:183-1997(+)